MVRSLWFSLLFLPFSLLAQFTYVMEQNIPVKDLEGNSIQLPWAGGLNAAHYNTMDLNGDNKEDLVIYDRMADRIMTFVREGNDYKFAPEFEEFFPDEITNWVLLRDFNCDGRKDLFTGDIFGMNVFTNTTEPGQPLSWEKFLFYTGFPGNKSEALLTTGLSGNKINLQLQFDDLPSITDADGDGDLDIFNLRFVGEGSIEFHRNYSKERYGTCDSLDFEKMTQKWAGLAECECAEFAFNNEDCGPIGGRTKHAAGKSLLMMDINGDTALDILFSEADCTNLYVLLNEGSTANPVINSSATFPNTLPVDFQIFPAAFYEDVDFDGVKDLISTPNIFSKTVEIINADLSKSNWFYKNNGTNTSPSFSFVSKSFLQDRMIDVGDNAVPAFVDYDGDGDQDLYVSQNTSSASTVATVRLYENTGTASAPEFALADNDALGFSRSTFYNLKIQFVDINRDVKTDLVFTATDFLTGQTKLYYLPNTSSSKLDFSGQTVQVIGVPLLSTENVTIVDVDDDGFRDLLIGKSNGALQFWKNQKTEVPSFWLEDESFLAIGPNVVQQSIAGVASDLDADGKLDLILGDQTGVLKIISNFRAATDTTGQISAIIFNPIAVQYKAKNLGGRLWPTTANLFNTNKPAVVVGSILGGVQILRNDEGKSLPEDPTIVLYPNPIPKGDELTVKIDRPAVLQIFGSLGQAVTSPVNVPGSEHYRVTLPPIAAGLYFLRFETQGRFHTRRLVIK